MTSLPMPPLPYDPRGRRGTTIYNPPPPSLGNIYYPNLLNFGEPISVPNVAPSPRPVNLLDTQKSVSPFADQMTVSPFADQMTAMGLLNFTPVPKIQRLMFDSEAGLPVQPELPVSPAQNFEIEPRINRGLDSPEEDPTRNPYEMEATLENAGKILSNLAQFTLNPMGFLARAVGVTPTTVWDEVSAEFNNPYSLYDEFEEELTRDYIDYEEDPFSEFENFDFEGLPDASTEFDDVGAGDEAGDNSGPDSDTDAGAEAADNDDEAGEDPDY